MTISQINKKELEKVVILAESVSECLKLLNINPNGSAFIRMKQLLLEYKINTSHFNKKKVLGVVRTTEELLVENSTASRGIVKKRLYREGLKTPICELCGQDENWNGKRMSLILDHINGVNNDNRIENLQIVCPNCNATLDTFSGKNVTRKQKKIHKACYCGNPVRSKYSKYCSSECLVKKRYTPEIRKKLSERYKKVLNRPTYKELMADISITSFVKIGEKYGVSDNTIRKWIKNYNKT